MNLGPPTAPLGFNPACPVCACFNPKGMQGSAMLSGQDPISDFLVVELRPYVKANCPYFFENDSRQVCSVSQLDGPEAGAPLDLFPGESAPFVA